MKDLAIAFCKNFVTDYRPEFGGKQYSLTKEWIDHVTCVKDIVRYVVVNIENLKNSPIGKNIHANNYNEEDE